MSETSNIIVYLSNEQAISVGINPAAYRGETAIPNLQAGTVGVGEDAQDVSVTITGEYPDYYLNFILPPGQLGKTPVFSIGSVTTGAAPSVTITGTDEEPVQNIVLPIAPTPDIKIGTVTDGDTPGVTISGTPEEPVLNFTLVKGEKGDIGVTPSFSVGDVTTGANPEVDVTGTAENPVLNMVLPVAPTPEFTIGDVIDGAAPDVTISGTVQEPVLNFTLPKGEKGDTGTTPSITIGSVTTGEQADAEITGSAEQPVLNLVLPVAPTPEFSVGDVVDGTTPDVTITGTVQNPVLNFTQVKGEQGNGIASVVRTGGTGAAGSVDTYTITFTDGTTTTFNVYNGQDGTGTGDMTKAVYDTNNNGIVDSAEVADALSWGRF